MKKNNRIKIQAPEVIVSDRHDAERVVGEIALGTANKLKLVAAMDAEIQAVKEKYGSNIAAYDAGIQSATEALSVWASANPNEFPKDRKSLTFVGGRIGFRTATPSLQPLNRKWTWEKITAQVSALMPHFTRSNPVVDKEALIAQRDEPAIAAVLPICGMKVVQGESFFVEPDLTPVQTRQVTKAEAA